MINYRSLLGPFSNPGETNVNRSMQSPAATSPEAQREKTMLEKYLELTHTEMRLSASSPVTGKTSGAEPSPKATGDDIVTFAQFMGHKDQVGKLLLDCFIASCIW